MDFDDRVKIGLSEKRFVRLIVSMPTIAININHHIATELLSELKSDLSNLDHREWILSIDVENRRIDHFGHIGAIARGTCISRERGEADLIVDHEVYRSTGAIAGKLRHVEDLRNDALSDKSGVSMH